MIWQHFYHGADIGVRGIGYSKASAFEQAALGLTAVVADLKSIADKDVVAITCQAPDDEILFFDWLNQLVFAMATKKMLFSRFEVIIKNHQLQAKAWGEPVDLQRHHPAVEIKGATFTELKVAQDKNGDWVAQCVVDV